MVAWLAILKTHGMTIENLLFHITIQQNPLSHLELLSIEITWKGADANLHCGLI